MFSGLRVFPSWLAHGCFLIGTRKRELKISIFFERKVVLVIHK